MSNETGAIKSYIERLDEVLDEIETLQSDEKETFSELKQKGHPTDGLRSLVSQAMKDSDKVKKTLDNLKRAGSLAGVPVYAEKVDPDKSLVDPLVQQRLQSIVKMRLDKKDQQAVLKDILKEAKNEGFDTKVLMQVVKILRGDIGEYETFSLTLGTYLDAARS